MSSRGQNYCRNSQPSMLGVCQSSQNQTLARALRGIGRLGPDILVTSCGPSAIPGFAAAELMEQFGWDLMDG